MRGNDGVSFSGVGVVGRWILAFVGMTEYFPDFTHFDSLPPSEALISLCTTEKQCLVAHDIYLIINTSALEVCEVGASILTEGEGGCSRDKTELTANSHVSA